MNWLKIKVLAEAKFAHLHNHTQFSVLQSTIGWFASGKRLKKRAQQSL
jgi:DNA polymerase III alpha subunit